MLALLPRRFKLKTRNNNNNPGPLRAPGKPNTIGHEQMTQATRLSKINTRPAQSPSFLYPPLHGVWPDIKRGEENQWLLRRHSSLKCNRYCWISSIWPRRAYFYNIWSSLFFNIFFEPTKSTRPPLLLLTQSNSVKKKTISVAGKMVEGKMCFTL